MRLSKNIKIVLDILRDEVAGDTKAAIKKMAADYTMTWVYESKGESLFPRAVVASGADLNDAYIIKGRKYEILNIAEGKNLVMVELIESYPDPETKKVYRTPLVLVLKIKNGKISYGRHYCDPRLSYRHLTSKELQKAYTKSDKIEKTIK
jgi:ketosteroid isomerase-like protein